MGPTKRWTLSCTGTHLTLTSSLSSSFYFSFLFIYFCKIPFLFLSLSSFLPRDWEIERWSRRLPYSVRESDHRGSIPRNKSSADEFTYTSSRQTNQNQEVVDQHVRDKAKEKPPFIFLKISGGPHIRGWRGEFLEKKTFI